jgi:hypothetical protein
VTSNDDTRHRPRRKDSPAAAMPSVAGRALYSARAWRTGHLDPPNRHSYDQKLVAYDFTVAASKASVAASEESEKEPEKEVEAVGRPRAIVSAVARLRPEDRERYMDEWAADYQQISGHLRRWCYSLELRWSARQLARRAQGRAPVASGG